MTFVVFQYSTIQAKGQKCRAALGLMLHNVPRNLGLQSYALVHMEQTPQPKGKKMARMGPANINKQTSNTLADVQCLQLSGVHMRLGDLSAIHVQRPVMRRALQLPSCHPGNCRAVRLMNMPLS